MAPEETRIIDRLVLLQKLIKLRSEDRKFLPMTNEDWTQRVSALETAQEKLSSGMSAYVAHGMHENEDPDRKFGDGWREASAHINTLFSKTGLAAGERGITTRQAVLDAIDTYGIVLSSYSLRKYQDQLFKRRAEVRDAINSALIRSAEAGGHADAVMPFTELAAWSIGHNFAEMRAHVHDLAVSPATIFKDENVCKLDPISWDAQGHVRQIAEVEAALAALGKVRTAAERRAKRPRHDLDPLPWQDQRGGRLRSSEEEVIHTAALRPLKRARMRGAETILARAERDARPRASGR